MMKRSALIICLFSFICINLLGQKPEIITVDKTNGPNGDRAIINGNDFGTNPANLKVFFGGAPATILNSGNQILEVEIPSGATFDNISVTNTSNGLRTYSKERFFINYRGEHGLTPEKFGTQTDANAESGLYDVCLCDFNSDGKLDAASVGEKANTVSFLTNNTAVGGAITLAKTSMTINAETLHVTCGDLNGDGRPEIIATENDGNRIFILKNNGNGTFTTQSVTLTGNKVKQVSVADLDLNGKPDLVVSDQLKNIVTIVPNNSSLANITFGAPKSVTLTGAASSDGLDIQDFNGDGLPEIVASPFLTSGNNKIFVLINNSSPGNFNFDDMTIIEASNTIVNIKAGDLDGDGKADFAVTRILNSDIHIYRNTSTDSQISFAPPVTLTTASRPWGIDFGDLDGDSKLDIVVASIDTKSLTVLNNESTSGNISFATRIQVPTTFINKHLKIADMDGDGKPDITFTSIDDGNLGIIASKVSVIKNKGCLVPEITPNEELIICEGVEFQLHATKSAGTNYQWKRNGAAEGALTTNNTFVATQQGSYTVTAGSPGCEKTSQAVQINTASPGAGLNGNDPDARNDGPVCSGNTLTLTVNDVDATSYRWKGPNNFEQTTTNFSITLPDFQLANTGLYIVEMLSNNCVSKVDSTLVAGVNIPEFSVNFSGSEEFCVGSSKVLSSSPLVTSGFTFQWFKEGSGAIGGATSSSYGVVESGEYFLQAQSNTEGCDPVTTEPVTLITVEPPVAEFTVNDTLCVGTPIEITNISTFDANAEPVYTWNMGEGDPIISTTPTYTYQNPAKRTIQLTITYEGVSGCSSQHAEQVDIVNVAETEILSNVTDICPGDTVVLRVNGDFESVSWSTSTIADSLIVLEPGDYGVTTVDEHGCEAHDEISLGALDKPILTINVPKTVVVPGEPVQLVALIEDPLDDNATYLWSPQESLDNATIANPTATPTVTTTYILIATSEDGCAAVDSVQIQVSNSGIAIKASPLFSPNNDGDNDSWTILGVENYPTCTLNIFDSKGRRVFEKMGYQNDWKAEYNGNPLPQGVYYFVFGCESEKPLTGTVNVIR